MIQTNRNKRLYQLNAFILSIVPGSLQEIYNADSVDKAKVNELNHTVELLNLIAGSVSLPGLFLSLKEKNSSSSYFETSNQIAVVSAIHAIQ